MIDRKIKMLEERISMFEARIASGAVPTGSARTTMLRSIAQCRRRLSEATNHHGEPSQFKAARLQRQAATILRDQELIAELDKQRAEAVAIRDIIGDQT